MSDSPLEDPTTGEAVVHVRVELGAAEIGELAHVVVGDRARCRPQRFTDRELVEILREGMSISSRLLGPGHELVYDPGQRRRRTLERRSLHVVKHASRPAHLLAAAGTAGTTMHEIG